MREIALGKEWFFAATLRRRNLITNQDELVAGATVRAMFATSSKVTGTPLHPELDIALTEQATGFYSGSLPGLTITNRLTDFIGKTVYQVIYDGTNARDVEALTVVDPASD